MTIHFLFKSRNDDVRAAAADACYYFHARAARALDDGNDDDVDDDDANEISVCVLFFIRARRLARSEQSRATSPRARN